MHRNNVGSPASLELHAAGQSALPCSQACEDEGEACAIVGILDIHSIVDAGMQQQHCDPQFRQACTTEVSLRPAVRAARRSTGLQKSARPTAWPKIGPLQLPPG